VFDLAAEVARRLIARDGLRAPPPDPQRVEAELPLAPGANGLPLEEVASRLDRLVELTPNTAGPRYFNQLFAGRDDAALLGEIVAATANNSMYTYKAAGAQILMERALITHMGAKVGWPDAEGAFTPGGSLSNFAAMLVARNETLEGVRNGGFDGRPVAIYTSAESHYSIRKDAGMLGIGRDNVRAIAADAEGRMLPDALAEAIASDKRAGITPVMINATAGTTVQGAFDPVREIAAVARDHGVWLHVDGAFGGSVLLSRRRRHMLDGCELADSFTWDAHKVMGVPLTCSVVLFPKRGQLQRSLDESASYLFQRDGDEYNPGVRSLQCGRRNDALKLWTAWMHHGDDGYERRIERLFALTGHAVTRIDADPDLTLVKRPPFVNVCFTIRGVDAAEVCDRLDREGRIKVSHGAVDGRPTVRLVCANPQLSEHDLDEFFGEVKAVADAIR
jgi:glutamate/tyrosine decarboxylase-like PLP-dependent enzyme